MQMVMIHKKTQWLYEVTSHKASIKNNNGDIQMVVSVDSINTVSFRIGLLVLYKDDN